MAIDWNWPVEFNDGTPAWLDPNGQNANSRFVLAASKPSNVPMAKEGRLYSLLADENDERLRNVDLPVIRFEGDGTAPSKGTFASPHCLVLWSANGFERYHYGWPELKGLNPLARKVTTLTRKQVAAAAQVEQEQAALEEGDLFGMF